MNTPQLAIVEKLESFETKEGEPFHVALNRAQELMREAATNLRVLDRQLGELYACVDEQASDDSLWREAAETAIEGQLRNELSKIHNKIQSFC